MTLRTKYKSTENRDAHDAGLSERGQINVDHVMAKVPRTILEDGYVNVDNVVNMLAAENWLIRDEILEIQKRVMAGEEFNTKLLSWPTGFWGDPELLRVLARFFNGYFNPWIPVADTHISLAPGVAQSIDAVLYNICNPGDGVLCPAPYWNGYDVFCRVRSSTVPVPVAIDSLDDEGSFLKHLDKTYAEAKQPIKALNISNPNNPLGRCFSKSLIEACLRFCQSKNIHFISDEVFAPFTFGTLDEKAKLRPFISVLSIDLNAINVDPSRVHVLWGPSKILAMAGLRIGCTITQHNPSLRNALTLASLSTTLTPSSLLLTSILTSPSLPNIIALNKSRLLSRRNLVTDFLDRHHIPYQPVNAGVFIMAKLAPHATTWEDEADVVRGLSELGVWVAPGRDLHLPEHERGWVRITYALEEGVLREGLRRIALVLDGEK